jgi:hypothetical protein
LYQVFHPVNGVFLGFWPIYILTCVVPDAAKPAPDLRHTTANSANPAKDLKKTAPTTDHKPVCAGESKVNKE